MAQNIPIKKELIIQFFQEAFPGHEYAIGNNYWFVHASTKLGWLIHYEYNNGRVHMDIEGESHEWRAPRNFFRSRIKDSRVFSIPHYRNDCRWTLDKEPNNWEEIKAAFKELQFIMKPHILAWEKVNSELNISTGAEAIIANVRTKFNTLRNILSKKLYIPNYQRPYEWNEKNVGQLLSDINSARQNGKNQYLIGSLILHYEEAEYNKLAIVDGQQRLTTLILILRALQYEGVLPDLTFNNSISFSHIKINHEFISRWLNHNLSSHEHKDFIDYILDSCRFVEIIVSDLSEAFQLFETQNGRGKELEAYNLLKAYHLRAMKESTQMEKIDSDIRWENAALFIDKKDERIDLLRQIINEHLFRIRIWSKGESAGKFSKKEVDEFKGLTIGKEETLDFPYQNIMLQQQIAMGFLQAINQGLFKVKDRFLHGDPENMSPFVSINQLIINGKSFFDYVETYIEIYKRLFVSSTTSQLSEFKTFYNRYCKEYPGANRVGDGYIRQVYKSAIMLIFDRFGEQGVNEMYLDLYIILYFLRLTRHQIKYATMMKKEESGWIFSTINNAKSVSELIPIRNAANERRFLINSGKIKPVFQIQDITNVITGEFMEQGIEEEIEEYEI